MTLAEFIQELANRTNFDIENVDLKQIVTNPTLSQIQLPKEYLNNIQSKLYTEDEAKINPNLNNHFKKHYIGTALNTVDSKISELLNKANISDELKQQILSEENTYNKINLFSNILDSNKNDSMNEKQINDKNNLVSKVQELQELLEFERENRSLYIDHINNDWNNKLLDKEINSLFTSYDYAIDIDKNITAKTARELFEQKLNEIGGKYVFTENGVKLVNKDTPDLPFTINNKQVDLKSFADNILAESKLLKVHKVEEKINTPINNNFDNFSKSQAPAAKSQTSKALADFKAGTLN